MLTTILAYLLIMLFFATESRARQGERAKSLDTSQFDQRSTLLIGMAYLIAGLGLLLAPVLNAFGIGGIDSAFIGWLGLFIAVGGVALRGWANRTLGEFYTRTLLVTQDQPVVQQGPYRVIRHPGYLGSILMWLGAALATLNWLTVILAAVVMFSVYVYRIQAEEAMLRTAYRQQYVEYQARTWKLIPFVY